MAGLKAAAGKQPTNQASGRCEPAGTFVLNNYFNLRTSFRAEPENRQGRTRRADAQPLAGSVRLNNSGSI